MKHRTTKILALILVIACTLCFPIMASATSQGTDGTELEVLQPEKLEIHLGTEWAGVEFSLKTDVGMYPATIPVGEDGVLRLEVGGSTSYILTRLNSSVEAPEPGIIGDAFVASAPERETISDETTPATDSYHEVPDPTEEPADNTVAGIPVAHVAMFGGGLIIAIGALIVIQLIQKHRASKSTGGYDENDEF